MIEKVNHYVSDEEVSKILCDFIDYKEKEGFPFAELVSNIYHILAGTKEAIIDIAAAMECLILSLDIFDDIEDGDYNNPPWMKLPKNIVTNAASCLLMISSKMIEESHFDPEKKLQAKSIFHECFINSVIGQHHELSNHIKTESDYLEVTRKKSGSLLSLAVQLGAVFSTDHHLLELKAFGELLGIKAQIDNDIRDVVANSYKNDLIHKKMTLPILYLLNQRAKQLPMIVQYYEGRLSKEEFINQLPDLIPIIEKSGAIEYALVIGKLKAIEAKKIIDQMQLDDQKKKAIFAVFPQ